MIVGGRTGGWEGAGGWYGGCGGAADTDTDVTIKTDAKKAEMKSFTKDTPIACRHGKDRSFQTYSTYLSEEQTGRWPSPE